MTRVNRMLEQWIQILSGEDLNLTATEIADICWMALIQHHFGTEDRSQPLPSASSLEQLQSPSSASSVDSTELPKVPPQEPPHRSPQSTGGLFTRDTAALRSDSKLLRTPTAKAFRDTLPLARALLPLKQQRPTGQGPQLDEPATVQKIAEERVWCPVTKSLTENWLELALVVDESASMLIWRRTIQELDRFFKHYGIFRDVRLWGLMVGADAGKGTAVASKDENPAQDAGAHSGDSPQPAIFVRANPFDRLRLQDLRRPDILLDPAGRRLILIVTDCVDSVWQTPQLLATLNLWANSGPMAILQMMPEWLWQRTNLRQATVVNLQAKANSSVNSALEVVLAGSTYYRKSKAEKQADIKIPIITLEFDRVHIWTQMLANQGSQPAPGVIFNPRAQAMTVVAQQRRQQKATVSSTAESKAKTFRGESSPMARRLASLLAASPAITLPIVRMVQDTLLRHSEEVHVAEVLLGGILQPKIAPTLETNPDDVQYQFVDPEIRSALLKEAPVKDTTAVFSNYIQEHFNQSLADFILELRRLLRAEGVGQDELKPIATIAAEVLQYRGAEYADFVREVHDRYGSSLQPGETEEPASQPFPDLESFDFMDTLLVEESDLETAETVFPPPLQTQEFTIVTFEVHPEAAANQELEPFEFIVATLQRRRRRHRKEQPQTPEWVIQHQPQRAYRLVERLSNNVSLEMVAVPGGTFFMGSPKPEPERYNDESPQHEVTVESCFMGRYPITQAQWRAVATMPQVAQELDPDPSHFKGNNRPVEQVSWHDAVEFCVRLSAHTGRPYRLPTEAEWEYACRAGTDTPFHFGKTLTTEVANYNGTYAYGDGPQGEYRQATTPVEHFGIANVFGLSDMHGNVDEWCQDFWHRNYEGAPTDGSAWNEGGNSSFRVLRGGSWFFNPRNCRSAYRSNFNPDDRSSMVGFRVCCSSPRTL